MIDAKVVLSKGKVLAAEVANHSDIMSNNEENTKYCYMKLDPKTQNITFYGSLKGYPKPTQHELKVAIKNNKVFLNNKRLSNKDYTFLYMTNYAGVRLLN